MPAKIRYREDVYRVERGFWRGKDGHTVHLLTWISDDLIRLGEADAETADEDMARLVASRLGEDAVVLSD